MSFQELKRYHEELLERLEVISSRLDRENAERLHKVTIEIEAAFHAMRAKLPDARTEQG